MELNFKKQNPYDDVPTMQSNSLVKGVFGAVLGSLPGIILWIIVAYLGYTTAIVGFVMACGIKAETSIVPEDVTVQKSIVIDEHCQTTCPDMYAAGDGAQFRGIN